MSNEKETPDLPGEEGWESDEGQHFSSNSSGSSSSESTSSSFSELNKKQRRKQQRSTCTVSIHRADISSTTGQEGNEELQDLNVDVYDQQTYERGVFKQVDNAISQVHEERQSHPSASSLSSSKQSSSPPKQKTDFLSIVHAHNDKNNNDDDENEICDDPTKRDEQLLELFRQQRLNKQIVIKQESIDPKYLNSNQIIKSLPKIPRLSSETHATATTTSLNSPNSNQNKSTLSSDDINLRDTNCPVPNITIKQEIVTHSTDQQPDSDHESSSSNESAHSEYIPCPKDVASEAEDDAEFDYETDEQLGPNQLHDSDDEETKSRNRKLIRLKDDGDLKTYQKRIKDYNREIAKIRLSNIQGDGVESKNIDELVTIEGSLQIPRDMWDNLFEHQKTGVRWLWELHQLGTGGILGDEMGLGKTIQMIGFLTALKSSEIRDSHKGYKGLGSTVLVCPATVMHQWLLEFRKWYPPFRVAILHNTGTFCGDRKNLVEIINKSKGVLIVSYPGVVIYQDVLHDFDWHYAILDEGHKIRNPDAQVTLACKRFRTPHRIILSGSPVQNNLKELWSIFDFIYPGKLGTLPVFMEQFATPITQGGYSNASDVQVQIAYKCACVLRDTIKPFLLRRTKAEVNTNLKLPDRSEQVLFCKLTEKQRSLYEAYLKSPTIRDIKAGFCQIFVGLIQLRKICNHPDLFDASNCKRQIEQMKDVNNRRNLEFFSEDETYGHINKSGKMMVVDALLKLWKKQGHKVLLFTQSKQMLKIFMNYLDGLKFGYLYMDGSTSIGNRQSIIERFNEDEEIFIFLLTTRVGGVGINLTAANRIIIYDPDWNPSTDIQARERAWRIGQKRHVIIYRLLTAGTIEEKIYHRQVFKLYLTNRILKNAKQKRFFKTNDLHELFTLNDNDKNIETKALFDDDLQIDQKKIEDAKRRKKAKKAKKKRRGEREKSSGVLSEEKLQAMRKQAKKLSQMIASKFRSSQQETIAPVRIKIEPGLERLNSPQVHVPGGECFWTPFSKILEPSSSGIGETNNVLSTEDNIKDSSNKKIHISKVKKGAASKQHLNYLVKQDVYKPANDKDKSDKSRYKKDDYILGRLFKSSNISGALKHDRIESDSTDDYRVVESEAEKVARDAIIALRESRSMCLDSTAGVPNWTGRNGHIANRPRLMPKNKNRLRFLTRLGGPSTSTSSSSQEDSMLSSIRKRNQSNPITMSRRSNGALALAPPGHEVDDAEEDGNRDFIGKSNGTGAEVIADKLREFILFKSARNGESQTDEVLDFFKTNFSPEKTPIFKALLYKMCEFQRRGDKGFWVLKSDFRDI